MPNNWSVTYHHAAIRVRDIKKSIEFYRDTLGLELLRTAPEGENPNMAWFPGLQLIQQDKKSDGESGWRLGHLAFQPTDSEEVVKDLKAHGFKFKPHEPGRPWFFEDPDGVLIELLH